VRVSVDVVLETLTCGMLMVLRAVCVFELLNTLNCAVQLLCFGFVGVDAQPLFSVINKCIVQRKGEVVVDVEEFATPTS